MAQGEQRAHDLFKGFEDYYSYHDVLDGSGEGEVIFEYSVASVSIENAGAADMWITLNGGTPTADGVEDTAHKMIRVPAGQARGMDKRTSEVHIAGVAGEAYYVVGLF